MTERVITITGRAWQVPADTGEEIVVPEWAEDASVRDGVVIVSTKTGDVTPEPGQWVVLADDAGDDLTVMSDEDFAATYSRRLAWHRIPEPPAASIWLKRAGEGEDLTSAVVCYWTCSEWARVVINLPFRFRLRFRATRQPKIRFSARFERRPAVAVSQTFEVPTNA